MSIFIIRLARMLKPLRIHPVKTIQLTLGAIEITMTKKKLGHAYGSGNFGFTL